MVAGGELNNLILVWKTVVASLCYCYIISKIFTKSSTISRFLYFLPVNLLFLVLPLISLSSLFFGGTTCFCIAWLANFKLLLFALNKGPLFSNPTIPLSQFIVVACFPVKVRDSVNNKTSSKTNLTLTHQYFISTITTRIILIAILIGTLKYREYIHPVVMLMFHALRVVLSCEILLTLFAALARALLFPLGVELEQPFDKFYLSTSVQNFWGKRWNRVVSGILRSTVYVPVRSASARFITRKWASIPAVLVTFVVSGLMHELVLFNFARMRPSGQMTCFFLLNGLIVSVEIVLKKNFGAKFEMPRVVSWLLTTAFMSSSASWLFVPPISAAMADLMACTEAMALFKFVFTLQLVPPADLRCPFL